MNERLQGAAASAEPSQRARAAGATHLLLLWPRRSLEVLVRRLRHGVGPG